MQLIVARITNKYTTVLKGLSSYKNSTAQTHFHSYVRDEGQFKKIKSTIDYNTINKHSKGKFMFREFLFQEKVEQNYIAPLNCYLMPAGKWTRSDLGFQTLVQSLTKTEEVNQEIVTTCGPALQGVFRRYYQRIGKPNYKFILQEQIGKIGKMPKKDFNKVIVALGGEPEADSQPSTKP